MGQVRKFRKLPVTIEAMQWHGGPGAASEVIDWILTTGTLSARWHEERKERRAPNGELSQLPAPEHIAINTLEGTMRAVAGDYIIRGVQGEFYPCKPDIFAATYEVING